jgi:hypothetical protein
MARAGSDAIRLTEMSSLTSWRPGKGKGQRGANELITVIPGMKR